MNKELLKYGNELSITGLVLGNGKEARLIWFPDATILTPTFVKTDFTLMKEIIHQLDTLGVIGGFGKAVLRKSQRNIDQNASWEVFRRDGCKCRYCGNDKVAMTVDHIVRWENRGDSVPSNLITACRKCNNTRGSQEYEDWLKSEYYEMVSKDLTPEEKQRNIDAWEAAKNTPVRPNDRSR